MSTIIPQLEQARKAKIAVSLLSVEKKKEILSAIAAALVQQQRHILQENKKDLARMEVSDSKYDRLLLSEERIAQLAESVDEIANLDDPTGKLLLHKTLENGLHIEKRTVALGVVGVIYESRPNVTIDVAALCIQSGNVCLLRGGSDAWYTNTALVEMMRTVLIQLGVDPNSVQLLPTDRAFVHELLTATSYVDIIIPRGSQSLIDFVRDNAKVPVIETGAGVCHTFVDASADLDKALKIVANAKTSRPSVCNALDTILLSSEIAEEFLHRIGVYFDPFHVEVFADDRSFRYLQAAGYRVLTPASEEDFGREFLDFKCSVKVVDTFEEALEHIATYSSKHSECIVSQDAGHIATFMNRVDAAAVYANASTRFTDGGEFGLGAEIGISTQKLHARGPFALEKLVTEKWLVTGEGQVR